MPTHDYIIANGTGAAVRADINSALSAIVSLNSSASEPGTMYAYQLWADTANGLLKIRNGANSAWITLRQLDGDFSIVAVEDGLQATPSLTFTNDLNTGVFRSGADALAIVTGGQYAIACTSTQAVGIRILNPSQALHVAGIARVGADDATDAVLEIGAGASGNRASFIDIVGDTTYSDYGLRVIRNNTGANATSELKHRGTGALNFTTQEAAPIVFNTTNSPSMAITSGGLVGIGTTSPATALNVQASAGEIVRATVSSNTGLYANIGADGDGGWFGSNAGLRLMPSGTEKVRIDVSGRLLVGTSSERTNVYYTTVATTPKVQFETSGSSYSNGLSLIQYSASGFSPVLTLGLSASNTPGTNTAIASTHDLGAINFAGNDGTNFRTGASIICTNDQASAWAVGDCPGRLVFSTTPDSGSSPVERMRINEKGALKATTNSGTYVSSTGIYHELIGNHTGETTVILKNFNGSYDRPVVEVDCVRAANSAYSLIQAYSGGFADTEFNLRGDGNAFADGTFTGGGADYAEYFEWSDGNPSEEDRRGISVVLDGDKIRKAVAGEDPIGVISGNPSIVGDAAWNKWSGKYLRDEFGTYLLDENGDRQLNPAFDPDAEYIPREQRPEWDCVGLMGKLRIRKGQVTGSRWIKMRDINDSVEEWLVR